MGSRAGQDHPFAESVLVAAPGQRGAGGSVAHEGQATVGRHVRRGRERIQQVEAALFRLQVFGMEQIGRANVWTSVPNAHLVWRLLLEKKKNSRTKYICMTRRQH